MVMNREEIGFVSDLWVVDWRDGARIVACRSSWAQNTVGQDFLRLLTREESERLSAALFSYDMKPIVTETVDGQILIVLPSLMPSNTVATVIVPRLERQMLLRFLAKRSGIVFDWNDALFAEASGRLPGKVGKYEKELNSLLFEIQCLDFWALSPSRRSERQRLDGFLKKRVKALSTLTGCTVRWETTEQITDSESFDFGAVTNFLLVALLICRRTALDRCAEIGWDGERVYVSFLCEGISDDFIWGSESLDAHAEERRMHFGKEARGRRICLSLVPRVLEVSYLGLKAEQRFL